MKILNLALNLLIATAGFAVQAEVKSPGSFVPVTCSPASDRTGNGPSTDIVKAKTVCFGRITGANGQYLSVALNDDTTRVYSVVKSETVPTDMARQVTAARLTLAYAGSTNGRGVVLSDPRIRVATFTLYAEYQFAQTVSKLQGVVPGNLRINATRFEGVMTTMDTAR